MVVVAVLTVMVAVAMGSGFHMLAKLDVRLAAMDATMDERLGKMDERLGTMDERLGTMDERLGTMDERFGRMDERFGTMETEIVNMRNDISGVKEILDDPVQSMKLASSCAVRVKVFPAKKMNDEACGTLVMIGGEKFVMTNAHVIWKKKSDKMRGLPKCRRALVRVYRQGGKEVMVEETRAMMHGKRLDLALIPVIDPNPSLNFCSISRHVVDPSARMFGFLPSRKQTQERYVSAEVRAISHDSMTGTMPGTNGYSGLGYFYRGEVVVVHKGNSLYKGSVEFDGFNGGVKDDQEYARARQYKQALKESLRKVLEEHSKENVKSLVLLFFSLGNFWARNPVASGVHAKYAVEHRQHFVSTGDLPLCSD